MKAIKVVAYTGIVLMAGWILGAVVDCNSARARELQREHYEYLRNHHCLVFEIDSKTGIDSYVCDGGEKVSEK